MTSIGTFYTTMYLVLFASVNLGLRVYFDLENKDNKNDYNNINDMIIPVTETTNLDEKNMEKITLLTWSIASVGAILL